MCKLQPSAKIFCVSRSIYFKIMNVKTIERGIDLHTTSEFYTLVLQSILEEIDVGLHVVDEKAAPSFTIRK